jgi:thymidylate synthase (FAD)
MYDRNFPEDCADGFRAGKVKLVWVTPDADNLVASMARVSAPENQKKYESAPKLISYLIKHQHWSPFEMVNVVMEINTTRDIGRQILRHRSFSFQEFSQRYADPTNRQPLTTDSLNEFNSRENVRVKLAEFTKERDEWISKYMESIPKTK